ncbi:hypothetical protein DEF23_26415 [Marinitenerispora sediminis]|uniref:Uncharacterized protein n=1 Tax=Marinitenerispora sediminis TaxID=1931232 RepID=A0A368SY51_9ACTN|nr:hypothetical protein DEF23_26415 [Marinitenerispora sediminis]RCV47651.1 hypothetical protein DEF28_25700 [Marinitenerispora sediminis]RCV48498.1 hypothetical protein DEF24_26260 [Marinitenerispora sediminis]
MAAGSSTRANSASGLRRHGRGKFSSLAHLQSILLRIVLRPIDRTLTSEQANVIRNAIYQAVHEGPVMELI